MHFTHSYYTHTISRSFSKMTNSWQHLKYHKLKFKVISGYFSRIGLLWLSLNHSYIVKLQHNLLFMLMVLTRYSYPNLGTLIDEKILDT